MAELVLRLQTYSLSLASDDKAFLHFM